MEEIEFIIESTKEDMQNSIHHLEIAFTKIRAGRPSPAMLQDVKIEYYGALTPLSQVSNITIPDAMTLNIQPFDRGIIGDIERAIINANLGFAPNNNGENIIINIPPLTEERRRDLAKQAKGESENAKVGVRNHRQEANKELKKLEGVAEDLIKNAEEKIQKLTDNFIKKIEESFTKKEQEIMKV